MGEGTKKASWENVKFLIMMYVTPAFIKPDKSLLTRFDLISRFAKQDTQDCSEQEHLARAKQP